MPLSDSSLKARIISEMQSQGFNPTNAATNGEAEKFFEALAKAIVDEITTNAIVPVPGGSSAGNYPVT